MREDFDKLMQDLTLGTLVFGIAIGWSLYSVAHGAAVFVDGLTTHLLRRTARSARLSRVAA